MAATVYEKDNFLAYSYLRGVCREKEERNMAQESPLGARVTRERNACNSHNTKNNTSYFPREKVDNLKRTW